MVAQSTSLIRLSTPASNSSEQQIKVAYTAKPYYTGLQEIEVLNLQNLQSNGKVLLDLPAVFGCRLLFTGREIRYTDESNYSWYGVVDIDEEGSCKDATLQLTSHNGEKFGRLTVDNRVFEYFPLSRTKQIAYEINKAALGGGENDCATVDNELRMSSTSESTQRTEACVDTEIRTLVLWTAATAAAEPNMAARIALAMRQTSQAYANSQIDESRVNLVLAGAQLLPGFVEGSVLNDIDFLVDNPNLMPKPFATLKVLIL